jgi:putative transposase
MNGRAKHVVPPPYRRGKLKKLQRIEMENEILKATALLMSDSEQFSIIGKFRARYPVATLCHVFGFIAAATNTGKTVLKSQTADGLYFAVRYLNCRHSHGSAGARSIATMATREATRWGAGLLADS